MYCCRILGGYKKTDLPKTEPITDAKDIGKNRNRNLPSHLDFGKLPKPKNRKFRRVATLSAAGENSVLRPFSWNFRSRFDQNLCETQRFSLKPVDIITVY